MTHSHAHPGNGADVDAGVGHGLGEGGAGAGAERDALFKDQLADWIGKLFCRSLFIDTAV